MYHFRIIGRHSGEIKYDKITEVERNYVWENCSFVD